MSTLSIVSGDRFQQEVLDSDVPVLVDFYADWCGPCRMVAPILERLAAGLGGRAKIVKVNVDEDPHLAVRYQVSGIPTMILFQNGQPARVMVGLRPEAELKKVLEDAAMLPARG